MSIKVNIEIAPHVGIQDSDAGPVEYTHPKQDMVWFTSTEMPGRKFIGYLLKEPGGAFLPTNGFVEQPLGLQELISQAIDEKCGEHRPVGIKPLPMSALKKFLSPDDEEDDEEAEED